MSNFLHIILHGNVDEDFYIKNIHYLRERNVKMVKLGFLIGVPIVSVLFFFALTTRFLKELQLFYGFFTFWFILWALLSKAILSNHNEYVKFFYAILSGTLLTMTAIAGSLYSPDMCAVIFLVFLIFVPGLYVSKPRDCIITTVSSGVIFCLMVNYFKTDSYIIQVDIINTIFSMVIGVIYNFYSINLQLENIQASIILKEQSITDELTTMPNRRSFNKRIEADFENAKEEGLTIIMMDIDFFKAFNDSYGHLKGDECLFLLSKSIVQTAKQHDIFVARFGGEEIVAIVKSEDIKEIAFIANSFVKNIESLKIENCNSEYKYITISAGYASKGISGAQNFFQLIDYADEALYEAKRNGRNKSMVYKTKDLVQTKLAV